MCGIIGVLHPHRQFEEGHVEPALDAMALRGPDGSGIWGDDCVTLGHRRLSLVGGSQGQQPVCSPDGKVAIVVNGEFYDYRRIRKQLCGFYPFRTQSDSEILIPLYLRYGYEGMMKHLRGEFAFILYDKAKGLLVAGRDRFGIKPLCWYCDGQQLIVASKAKAIMACGIRAEWDETSLMQALSIHYQPTHRTFFKGISQLEPGHLLVSSMHCEISDIEYWNIDYPKDEHQPPPTLAQELQYVSEFHDLLKECIQLRLDCDVPVCCHLSGGLDSSAVVGVMSQLQDRPVDCFSIVFPQAGDEYDEEAYAAETVRMCGAVMHRVAISQHDILQHLSDAVFHSEGLAVNGHLSCKYLLNRKIREAGFKVALTGEGADECLAGYPHLRKDLFGMLPPAERERLTRRLYESNLAIMGTEMAVGDTLDCQSLKRRLGFIPSFLEAKASIGHKMYGLLTAEMRQRCLEHNFPDEMLSCCRADVKLAGGVHPVNKSLFLWCKHALCNYILGTLGDGCEMAASIEGRLPFLDHHLFEYAAALPMQMKISHSAGEKYILREAARPYITQHVYSRQKHPFQAPPLTRFFSGDEYSQIHDELTSATFVHTGIFSRDAVERLLLALPTMSVIEQTAYEPVLMLMMTINYMNQRFHL
jgi:asparagine synthase (glutamine-hydrolysing)